MRKSLTIGGHQEIPYYRSKSITIGGTPLLQMELPRHRRKSITIEGNPLLGTTPLSLEGIHYYRRKSLTI